ncbi:MAG: TlpA family protein disulfide reductase [Bacteroidales bacterium]|nr:TlpA family protein disulfide reductase [Bacteroidales bacterium]
MKPNGNFLEGAIHLQAQTFKYDISYISLASEGSDQNSYAESMENDGIGKPLLGKYPFYHLRDEWYVLPYENPEESESILKRKIDSIVNISGGDEIDAMYALATGYLLIDEVDQGIAVIKKMIAMYRGNYLTMHTLLTYIANAGTSKNISDQAIEEINKLAVDFVKRFPSSFGAREYLKSYGTDLIETKTLEVICHTWMKEDSLAFLPYRYLARRYLEEKGNMIKILKLCDKGISLLVNGNSRISFDTSGRLTNSSLSGMYQCKAAVLLENSRFEMAIEPLKAAQSFDPSWDTLYYMEGKAWLELGIFSNAMYSFQRARELGNVSATYLLETVPLRSEKNQKSNQSPTGIQEKAPDFSSLTIENTLISSKEMEGRIIVLNFWGTGCSPCIKEMSELNELVEEFHGLDVDFIAVNSDDQSRTGSFLERHPFRYKILCNDKAIQKAFQVQVLPTHVIINQQGFIHARLIGASETNTAKLREIIRMLIQQNGN